MIHLSQVHFHRPTYRPPISWISPDARAGVRSAKQKATLLGSFTGDDSHRSFSFPAGSTQTQTRRDRGRGCAGSREMGNPISWT